MFFCTIFRFFGTNPQFCAPNPTATDKKKRRTLLCDRLYVQIFGLVRLTLYAGFARSIRALRPFGKPAFSLLFLPLPFLLFCLFFLLLFPLFFHLFFPPFQLLRLLRNIALNGYQMHPVGRVGIDANDAMKDTLLHLARLANYAYRATLFRSNGLARKVRFKT